MSTLCGKGDLDSQQMSTIAQIIDTDGWDELVQWFGQVQVECGGMALKTANSFDEVQQLAGGAAMLDLLKTLSDCIHEDIDAAIAEEEKEKSID